MVRENERQRGSERQSKRESIREREIERERKEREREDSKLTHVENLADVTQYIHVPYIEINSEKYVAEGKPYAE